MKKLNPTVSGPPSHQSQLQEPGLFIQYITLEQHSTLMFEMGKSHQFSEIPPKYSPDSLLVC